ncbi:MAG: SDR family NAD(P)-dependent oxidoreductase, partial [Candidatus Aureabacteria bacterium]|nr:SDR family NAD(P)-dependent oxidoreductase [Candidatus Auribacterota bacterium]
MNRAIIIGASAGIGRELAKELARRGCELGLAARRIELLASLQREIKTRSWIKALDVTRTGEARRALEELICDMDGCDIVVISAGVIFQDPSWEQELETINVNVLGFSAMCNTAFNYFRRRGEGQIVGISSVAAVRGGHCSPVYNAS